MPATKKIVKKTQAKSKNPLSEVQLENKIRERAYFIWEEKNRLHGSELENWLQARNEIAGKTN